MGKIEQLAGELADIITNAKAKKTEGYDTPATVNRIEDGTAWVHIPGGVDETPVALTINAQVGDTVQVRVSGGRAWILGNATAPPTDDTKANSAAEVAQEAQVTATKAAGTATSAQATAQAAMATAGDAETLANTAYEIATATDQHFWIHPTSGSVYITTQEQEDYLTAPSGRALVITSSGMLMQEVTTEAGTTTTEYLATFNANGTALYQNGKVAATMTANGVTLYADDGTTPVATFSEDGATIGRSRNLSDIYLTLESGVIRLIANPNISVGSKIEAFEVLYSYYINCDVVDYLYESITTSQKTHSLRYTPLGTDITVVIQSTTTSYLHFEYGTPQTQTLGIFTVEYDGDTTFTYFRTTGYSGTLREIRYTTSRDGDGAFLKYGVHDITNVYKKGANAAMFGFDLTAENACQFTTGKCNDNQPDSAFEIGNGTSDTTRSNAFAVGWDGETKLAIDTSAASTTTDGRINAALTALGWTDVVSQ